MPLVSPGAHSDLYARETVPSIQDHYEREEMKGEDSDTFEEGKSASSLLSDDSIDIIDITAGQAPVEKGHAKNLQDHYEREEMKG